MKDLLRRGWLGEPVLAHHRDAGHPALDAVERGAAVAVHVRDEHPSPRHVPLLVRHARPRPGQHAARPAHALPAQRRHQPVHPRIRQRLPGRGVGRRLDRPGAAKAPRATSASAGASRGPRAWPAAPSAGRAIPRGRRARSISRRSGSRATGCSRAGRKCGSPMPSSARWPSCCARWRTARSRRSAAATTWKRSRCARRCIAAATEHRVTTVREFLEAGR